MTKQLNKEQVNQWQRSEVTEVLREVVAERMDNLMGAIVESSDSTYDARLKGMIQAFREILAWEPEFTESEDEIQI